MRSRSQKSLLVGTDFPVPERREFTRQDPRLGFSRRTSSAGETRFAAFPCIFSVDQGLQSRDEFAIDCTHRHSVRDCGDFPGALGHSLRKLRDSAGSWPISPRGSEPEMAGSGRRRRSSPRFLCWQVGRFGFASSSRESSVVKTEGHDLARFQSSGIVRISGRPTFGTGRGRTRGTRSSDSRPSLGRIKSESE